MTEPLRIAVFADAFPAFPETFVANEVAALDRLGHVVRVETVSRPQRCIPWRSDSIQVHYAADDGPLRRLVDGAWLVVRHPVRSLGDICGQRRWRTEEEVRPLRAIAPAARRVARHGDRHLHAHFARGAALEALRVARLLGRPYSLTAHAYDVFQLPSNLEEKLERARFVTTGCDYTVDALRGVTEDTPAGGIHKIVMGVDAERFRRRSAHRGGRTVVAVGRMVEKKGFRYLIEAAALLARRGKPLERLVIAGEGRQLEALRSYAGECGLADAVELPGALKPDAVRALLECADLLATPSIVADDGDRDSMPVVVKEALAMEVPVVATDEVGLPEVVRPGWGRLVPPRDAGALAAAIEEVLALPLPERRTMGRAGRAWVREHCSVDRETARLAEFIARAAVRADGPS